MGPFDADADEVLARLRRGTDVTVLGSRGSGRTHLLDQVVERADALGISSTVVRHSRRFSRWPLETLRAAGVVVSAKSQRPGPADYGRALATELQESGSGLLVVDDDDCLDPASRAAVDHALAESRVVLLVSRAPSEPDPERSTDRISRRRVSYPVPRLQFDQVGVVMQQLLGGPVDPSLVARVSTKTGGHVGLVGALTTSARDSGTVLLDRGRWVMASGTLWNDEIHEHVSELLAAYGDELIRAAHLLATAGGQPIAEARALVGDAILARLSQLGLVTVIGTPGPRPLVVLTPPLIADFLRRRPTDAISLMVSDQVTASLGLPDDLALRARRTLRGSGARPEPGPTDATIASYIEEEGTVRSRVLRSRWQEEPDLESTLAFLEAAWARPHSDVDLGEVITVARHEVPSAATSRRFVQFQALWAGLGEHDLESAVLALDAFVDLVPSDRPWAVAMSNLLEAALSGVSPALLAEVRLPDESPGPFQHFQDVVAAFVLAVAGHGHEALLRLGTRGDGTVKPAGGPPEGVFLRLTRGLAHMAAGDSDTLVREARHGLLQARSRLGKTAIVVEAYLLAYGSLQRGDLVEAQRAVDAALVLDDIPVTARWIHAAILNIARLLAAGRGTEAGSADAGVEKRLYEVGPLPGAQPGFAAALTAYLDRREDDALDELGSGAGECEARGWALPAVGLRVLAVCLAPSATTVEGLSSSASGQDDAPQRQLATFVEALLRAPGDAEAAARAYRPDSCSYAAATVCGALLASGVLSDSEVSAVQAGREALASAAGIRAGADLLLADPGKGTLLSERELEVSMLTATLTTRQIAERLGVSPRTVDNHVSNSMRKMGASDRKHLVEMLRAASAAR